VSKYYDYSKNVCVDCPAGCLSCATDNTGSNNNTLMVKCVVCKEGHIWQNGLCPKICDNG